MKKQITKTLLGFAMLFALAAAAFAQTARRVEVRVPFDFVAGEKHLPAGRYTVRRMIGDSEKTLLIQSEDGRANAVVITDNAGAPPERAELSFRQHGDQYFLASVSLTGTASVREAPESKAEKKLARELAEKAKAGDAGDKTVTVAGNMQ
jgi:hypothetical protein